MYASGSLESATLVGIRGAVLPRLVRSRELRVRVLSFSLSLVVVSRLSLYTPTKGVREPRDPRLPLPTRSTRQVSRVVSRSGESGKRERERDSVAKRG